MQTLFLMTLTLIPAQSFENRMNPEALPLQATFATERDMVLRWNNIALQAIRIEKTHPPVAARYLALMHAAIFDAVNGITGAHTSYLVNLAPLPGPRPEAAAASAAHRVLSAIYPAERTWLDRALADALAQMGDEQSKQAAMTLGRFVADRILSARARDGADRQTVYLPRNLPGYWRPTPPGFAEPLLPHWSTVTAFALDRSRLRPQAPPGLTDPAYTAAFREVKELGRIDSPTRTAEQTEIARFWADGAGTATPPGHWNQIAQTVSRQRGLTLTENARLFALLNIALADASIICWDCKYKFDYWRPVTGIRDADRSINPDTEPDPTWTPLLDTPPFPSYTSGHSTFSGAGATVLADILGDNVRFEATSEGLPGVTRRFDSFWTAAEEAGRSRIYGGIHWNFDNTEGLALGRTLGRYVCRSLLVSVPPPTASQSFFAPGGDR
jgi:hypothetical protein